MADRDTDDKIKRMRATAEIDNSRQDSRSRSKIAHSFTYAFISFFFIILVGAPIYNVLVMPEKQLNISELMTTFVAQFGVPLGFVLGYYFKDKNN